MGCHLQRVRVAPWDGAFHKEAIKAGGECEQWYFEQGGAKAWFRC